MNSSALTTKLLQPPVPRVLALLLGLVLLSLLADLVWRVADLVREKPLPASVEQITNDRAQTGPGYNLQSMLAVPLFGVAPQSASTSPEVSSENVKVSALRIKVLGLVAGSGDAGIAVLQYSGKTRAYAVGEKIEVPGDVSLVAVKADHVLIENNRRMEKLELEKRPNVSGVSASTVTAASSERVEINRPEIRALIGDPRQTVRESPLKLVRFFAISPVNEDGNVVGYSLAPGRDPRLFKLLDVQAGDVLLSVNGQPVASMAPPELLKMMEETSNFELLVKRGDAILTKRLEL